MERAQYDSSRAAVVDSVSSLSFVPWLPVFPDVRVPTRVYLLVVFVYIPCADYQCLEGAHNSRLVPLYEPQGYQ